MAIFVFPFFIAFILYLFWCTLKQQMRAVVITSHNLSNTLFVLLENLEALHLYFFFFAKCSSISSWQTWHSILPILRLHEWTTTLNSLWLEIGLGVCDSVSVWAVTQWSTCNTCPLAGRFVFLELKKKGWSTRFSFSFLVSIDWSVC